MNVSIIARQSSDIFVTRCTSSFCLTLPSFRS